MNEDQFERFMNGFSKSVNSAVMIARVDERTKNMERMLQEDKEWMNKHEEDDNKRFSKAFSLIYVGVGLVIAAEVLIGLYFKYGGA